MSTRITGKKDATATSPRPAPPGPRPASLQVKPSQKPTGIAAVTTYMTEVWSELRKTTWPGRTEFWSSVGLVLGVMVVVGAFIAISDVVLSQIVHWLLGPR
jgi:preprotein translocase SecE subunit